MKVPIRIPIALFFFLAVCLSITAQEGSGSILGTWDFNYQASQGKMDAKMKAYFAKLNVDKINRINRSYQGRKVTFNQDGTFSQTSLDGNDLKGTWKINDKAGTVEVTYPDGMVQPLKIAHLSNDRLTLVPKDMGKGQLFFPEWHFTKN